VKPQKSIALLLIALLMPFVVPFYASAQVNSYSSVSVMSLGLQNAGKDCQGESSRNSRV
jgi:hypothetical protein